MVRERFLAPHETATRNESRRCAEVIEDVDAGGFQRVLGDVDVVGDGLVAVVSEKEIWQGRTHGLEPLEDGGPGSASLRLSSC